MLMNDYIIQAVLPIALPEELGILDNVWVHITLSSGEYTPFKADLYPELRYHSYTGKEWPKLYNETTKEQVNLEIIPNNEFNTSVFGIIYTCIDKIALKGRFVVTFTAWKEEMLSYYYTEKKYFNIDNEDYKFF